MPPLAKPVIAGNWKMHNGPTATREFFQAFLALYQARADRSLIFFPPAVSLLAAVAAVRSRPDVGLGVQNVYWEPKGAFTGEVSAPMVREAGASFALAGHSERRHVFGESDQDVARKARAIADAGLIPVVCVGETLEERRAGRVDEVVLRQLDAVLDALTAQQAGAMLVAYEPVWAIGTGVNATPEDASAAHATLRRRLTERLGAIPAELLPILYGGSVKPDNADALLAASDVDGLLVGGASLDPAGFARIAAAGSSPADA
jgi:triosephosphate isomerase